MPKFFEHEPITVWLTRRQKPCIWKCKAIAITPNLENPRAIRVARGSFSAPRAWASLGHHYFINFAAAQSTLLKEYNRRVEALEKRLTSLKKERDKVAALTEEKIDQLIEKNDAKRAEYTAQRPVPKS